MLLFSLLYVLASEDVVGVLFMSDFNLSGDRCRISCGSVSDCHDEEKTNSGGRSLDVLADNHVLWTLIKTQRS